MRVVRDTAWKVRRHLGRGDAAVLRRLLPDHRVDEADVARLLGELEDSAELREGLDTPDGRRWASAEELRDPEARFRKRLDLSGPGRARALFLYVATRILAPKVVIETGCATGWDSAVLLLALERNGAGTLTSIDLPAREGAFSQFGADQGLPEGVPPGAMVADSLRHRWSLVLGNALLELPPLLERVRTVDLFFHDSHHTYDHMMWEFTTAWPYLAGGGVLVSDDVSWNLAASDFARGVDRPLVIHRSSANVVAVPRGANDYSAVLEESRTTSLAVLPDR